MKQHGLAVRVTPPAGSGCRDEPAGGVVVLRVEGGLFFANADTVRDRILAAASKASAVVLDCETVPLVDVSAAEMLLRLASDLDRRGIRLALARDIGQVRDILRTSGGDDAALGIHPSVDAAVAAVTSR